MIPLSMKLLERIFLVLVLAGTSLSPVSALAADAIPEHPGNGKPFANAWRMGGVVFDTETRQR